MIIIILILILIFTLILILICIFLIISISCICRYLSFISKYYSIIVKRLLLSIYHDNTFLIKYLNHLYFSSFHSCLFNCILYFYILKFLLFLFPLFLFLFLYFVIFVGLKTYHNESIVTTGGFSEKLFWDTRITLFNRTFSLDEYSENSNKNTNTKSNLDDKENSDNVKQVFLNKKSARNELAILILIEIDLFSYEEMLIGQEEVRKTLQNYRDGVLSGLKGILLILFLTFLCFNLFNLFYLIFFVLFCFVLFCFVLFCFVLSCFVLLCFLLFYFLLLYFVLPYLFLLYCMLFIFDIYFTLFDIVLLQIFEYYLK